MAEKINRFLDRFESRISLWLLIGGPAVASGITAYLSTLSAWISSYGKFAWVIVGLAAAALALVVVFLALEIVHRAMRQWAVRRWLEVNESVNPLESVFTNKRISLVDISDPLNGEIRNKTFNDCQLNGPCVIFAAESCVFKDVTFVNCDVVELRVGQYHIQNVLPLINVSVLGGRIARSTILVPKDGMADFLNMGMVPISNYSPLSA